nr:agmatinase [Calditrichia bacterium]
MKFEHRIERTPYEGCFSTYEEAQIVIIGAGYDGTVSYRPGSRFGPLAMRTETLYSQEDYSPYFRRDLKEIAIHDAGDIDIPFGSKDRVLSLIHQAVSEIVEDGKKPCMLGGEHLVTLPAVQAVLKRYPDLHIVQLDAHLDMIDELFGSRLSHGTVMRRCTELLESPANLWQVGIRSGGQAEFAYAEAHTRLFPFHARDFLAAMENLKDKPVYLTLDLDVFDPSLIPGTGTPEAGGIFFPEYIDILKA